MMIKIDLEGNIYLDELFIKRWVKTCVRQFKSMREIKEESYGSSEMYKWIYRRWRMEE